MYYCEECEEIFGTLWRYNDMGDIEECCPTCGSERVRKAVRCPVCAKWTGNKLGPCPDCKDDITKAWKTLMASLPAGADENTVVIYIAEEL